MLWDRVSETLGGYRLLTVLGTGGVSRVYQAEQATTGDQVAIKVMHLAEAPDPHLFNHWFHSEVSALKRLRHPNIVRLLDSGRERDFLYLVEQLVTGGTLKQHINRQMEVSRACWFILQMAHACEAAHTQRIIHRDIKPANMLIDGRDPDHVFLADFGIAKILDSNTLHVTRPNTAIGTPEYMAPEQCEALTVDARTDIYALAAVLYHLLAGRPPFIGDSPVAICYQHVHQPAPSILRFNPLVPIALEAVLQRALATNPDDRYQSAGEFARALAPYLPSTKLRQRIPALDAPQAIRRTPAARPYQDTRAPQDQGWTVPATSPPASSTKLRRHGMGRTTMLLNFLQATRRAQRRAWIAILIIAVLMTVIAGILIFLALKGHTIMSHLPIGAMVPRRGVAMR